MGRLFTPRLRFFTVVSVGLRLRRVPHHLPHQQLGAHAAEGLRLHRGRGARWGSRCTTSGASSARSCSILLSTRLKVARILVVTSCFGIAALVVLGVVQLAARRCPPRAAGRRGWDHHQRQRSDGRGDLALPVGHPCDRCRLERRGRACRLHRRARRRRPLDRRILGARPILLIAAAPVVVALCCAVFLGFRGPAAAPRHGPASCRRPTPYSTEKEPWPTTTSPLHPVPGWRATRPSPASVACVCCMARRPLVDDVNFDLRRGERLGVTGGEASGTSGSRGRSVGAPRTGETVVGGTVEVGGVVRRLADGVGRGCSWWP